ncbi:hypothetical protein [Saccharomonospora glauca]|jgi:hypothetical protein|uniref:Uncharacterized protein n=1 Tax=Saccharomonospora glauca K62 TaxID=928724 RepID=I1D7H8_9PSEU|nr:hypothetical protein [Saccharomonospora glauca]EIF00903.1 hypothetical protein SacglDRAFT_04064 [Saccharomonospora glauca K62]
MPDEPTAAVRYKEIMGRARKSADDLREWERRRGDELKSLIAAAEQRVEQLSDRETAVREQAHRLWRMALDNVKRLSWLDPGEPPSPSALAKSRYLDHYLDEVRTAYRALSEAADTLSWRNRR